MTYNDTLICRLHYKVTTGLLIMFAFIVITYQYLKSPIHCINDSLQGRNDKYSEKLQAVLDTYCWIQTTFSIPDSWRSPIPYPGVGPRSGSQTPVVHHAYYQWVGFVLLIQALMFYVPRYFWNLYESRLIAHLVEGFKFPLTEKEKYRRHVEELGKYFFKNRDSHFTFHNIHLLSELIFFVNAVCQMFLTDAFLGREFLAYGIQVMQWSRSDFNPMVKVFPRMTKCTFYTYGPSGDIQTYDSLCILPVNILNEKIYMFLWLWFLLLTAVSGIVLIYKVLCRLNKSVFICTAFDLRLICRGDIEGVYESFTVPDWFLLRLLKSNISSVDFKALLLELKTLQKTKEHLLMSPST